jgi:hypothetical protein
MYLLFSRSYWWRCTSNLLFSPLLNISGSPLTNNGFCPANLPGTNYYYSGSGWSGNTLYYFFGENNNYAKDTNYIPFAPKDQQNILDYSYYGIFYTYWWFSLDNSNNLDVYFLVNGNIYNDQLPEKEYTWGSWPFSFSAYAILPEPPFIYIAQSYENAYETVFLAEKGALNKYFTITYPNNFPYSLFINGTFGYNEIYESLQYWI